MQAGAFDYVMKPFSFEQIEVVVDKAASFDKMRRVTRYYVEEIEAKATVIVGKAEPIRLLNEMVRKVAATEATVLISGENGTGKELVARELYNNSLLADKPYIRVNCASISETLMESEFFGHEKGAYTGATERREGRFELADGGTLLLDEISEIAPALQAKLLRVLQEKEFERVGGNKTIQVKVRVLATTNRNLIEEVEKGKFREDLYYRLNVFPIVVPPLRDRSDDIPLLAETFLKRHARKHGLEKAKFSKSAVNAMRDHIWPGNVRELENAIERAVILADHGNAIGPELLGLGGVPVSLQSHLAKSSVPTGSTPDEGSAAEEIEEILTMEEIEREHILQALKATSGNRTKAAELLAINVRTLRNKIRQYKIDGESVP
jgi:DNA-binding NtrC family response regulator